MVTPQGTVVAYQSDDPKLETVSRASAIRRRNPSGSKTAKLEMVHAFVETPDSLKDGTAAVAANWKRELKPGESIKLQFVMAHGRNDGQFPSPAVVSKALDWAKHFDRAWDDVKSRWAQRWKDMFTPGNDHFSGHLPDSRHLRRKTSRNLLPQRTDAAHLAPDQHENVRPGIRHQRRTSQGRRLFLGHFDVGEESSPCSSRRA